MLLQEIPTASATSSIVAKKVLSQLLGPGYEKPCAKRQDIFASALLSKNLSRLRLPVGPF